MWEELDKILAALVSEYKTLLALAKKKHGILVSVNLPELEKVLKEEDLHAKNIAALEERRKTTLTKLASLDKALRPDMKMTELYEAVSNPTRRKSLEKKHEELTRIVDDTVSQNEVNSILVHGAMQAVSAKLNKLGGADATGGYGKSGDVVTHKKNFDFKA
ncbi:MAG: flagellar protein FlgN [Selenomonadaceae bacterium]|nr:flagellar protein FlgN [Selenomonadaceae bacterium]